MFLLMLVMQKKLSIAVFILVKTFIEGIQKLEETKSTIKSGAKKSDFWELLRKVIDIIICSSRLFGCEAECVLHLRRNSPVKELY